MSFQASSGDPVIPATRAAARPTTEAIPREFGGAVGAACIMVGSYLLVYYLWFSLTYLHGAAAHPSSFADLGPFLGRLWAGVVAGAAPTAHAALLYLGFLALQWLLARTMPGPWVQGFPVPSEGGVRHAYHCNGAASWYVTLAVVALLHLTGRVPLTELADHLGPMLSVAVLSATGVAVAVYLVTIALGRQTRMSGNPVYDFFMGAVLNPRVGGVDLKFFAEARVSWILLFLLTLSAAAKHHQRYGFVSAPMVFMVVAHGLYTNAVMKGEECIPTTWDIFHEKWGWMLIFWNLVGVPWVYSFNAYYLLVRGPVAHSPVFMAGLFLALFGAYYVWDSAQSQKNRFRMQERGTYVPRRTFPQLPWGTLKNPRVLKTVSGGTLLVDGWWAWARKIHYTADIVMAFTWALSCGFGGALPYLYPVFFLAMIVHRAGRDERRCAAKYGEDWDRYLRTVRWRFIPFVY
jgi:delta24(24(1))-sterol reductase